MPAYVIATTNVASPQQYVECGRPAGIAAPKYGGSFRAGDGGSAVLAGTLAANRDVFAGYPDLVTPSRLYDSQEHRALPAAHAIAAAFTLVAVSG